MSPLVILAAGSLVLMAVGIPLFIQARAQAAERRHMASRLEGLLAASKQIQDPAVSERHGAVNAAYVPQWVQIALARAGITLQWRAVGVAGGALVAAGGVVWLVTGPLIAAAAVATVVVGGTAVLRIVTARRLAAFVDGLPAYLDATRQLVMVGNSLQQAMVKAGDSCSPGVDRHIAPMLRRIQFGALPADVLTWLAERLDVVELHMLAAAVQTNARYGGRISAVLANLIQILRDRARIGRELSSATAETRVSGIVLASLPICVGLFVALTNPSYIRFFIDTHQGHTLILTAIGMEVSGVVVMRRIMRLDF